MSDVRRSLPLHEAALTDADAVARAMIPVERIDQPVFLQGALHDQIWPSSAMSDAIIARAGRLNPAHQITVKHYDDDHVFLRSNEEVISDLVAYLDTRLADCL